MGRNTKAISHSAFLIAEKPNVMMKATNSDGKQFFVVPSVCYIQSMMNKKIYERLGIKLHPVMGVLGVREKSKGKKHWVWMFGDYEKGDKAKLNNDEYHVWLEDDEGRVYDVVLPGFVGKDLLTGHAGDVWYNPYEVLEGVEKKVLKRNGLDYIRVADRDLEEGRLHHLKETTSFEETARDLLSGLPIKQVVIRMNERLHYKHAKEQITELMNLFAGFVNV